MQTYQWFAETLSVSVISWRLGFIIIIDIAAVVGGTTVCLKLHEAVVNHKHSFNVLKKLCTSAQQCIIIYS